jgi:hypothetical protein
MVLRGRDADSGRSRLFAALVSCEEGGPFRPSSTSVLATVRLSGDDVPRYVHPGSRFELWLGHEVGRGLVTRRLFT